MPIFQTNRWVCEVCGKEVSTTEKTTPYSDPVVSNLYGQEWEYVGEPFNEKLACPDCVRANKGLHVTDACVEAESQNSENGGG